MAEQPFGRKGSVSRRESLSSAGITTWGGHSLQALSTQHISMGLCLCSGAFSLSQVTRKLLTIGTCENLLCTNSFPPYTRKSVQALSLILSAVTQSFAFVGTQDLAQWLFQPPSFPSPVSKLLWASQVSPATTAELSNWDVSARQRQENYAVS